MVEQTESSSDAKISVAEGLEKLHAILSAVVPVYDRVITAMASHVVGAQKTFEAVSKTAVEGILTSLQDWEANREKYQQKQDLQMMWLLSFGWPPLLHAPYIATEDLYDYAHKMEKDEAQAAIDEAVLSIHTERIFNDMVANWEKRKVLANRMPILRSAVAAHQRGEYTLSVPAILPQIEGFIVETFGHAGHLRQKTYDTYVENLTKTGMFGMQKAYRKLIAEHLLGTFKHGDAIVFFINRHSIMHGADVNYAKAAISLRAILLFDFVVEQIRFAANDGDALYHRLSCDTLRNSTGRRKVYTWFMDLEGRTPCPDCKPDASDE